MPGPEWLSLPKEQAAKYGRVEIVDDPAQADASLVVIWGSDDSFITPSMVAYHRGDPVSPRST